MAPSTQHLIDDALCCPASFKRLSQPVTLVGDGWAYEEKSLTRNSAYQQCRSPKTLLPLSIASTRPNRALATLLQKPVVTAQDIMTMACPITMEAPLKLPMLTRAGHTYSGALATWLESPNTGDVDRREPLTGRPEDLRLVCDDFTSELLIDIAASDAHPLHRWVLSGESPHGMHADNCNVINAMGATPLHLAAKYCLGDGVIANTLLDIGGIDIHAVDACGRTALGHAVARQNDVFVWKLLDAGATPNETDYQGLTPIARSIINATKYPRCFENSITSEFVALLDVSSPEMLSAPAGPAGYTPLHHAIANLNWSALSELSSKGAGWDVPNAAGLTPRAWLAADNAWQQCATRDTLRSRQAFGAEP